MLDTFAQESARRGVRLAPDQLALFERYLLLLQTWSQRMNLVGDASPDEVIRRHFVESIALAAALRERALLRPGDRVVDVGAGAGFPGVPIKIALPSLHLTLIEATAKKASFLEALVQELVLKDTQVRTGRAETLAHAPDLRAGFDLVLARAVAPLATLLELALPFARVGGRLVTPKGSRLDHELKASERAQSVLGARVFVIPFDVPGPPQSLVIAAKVSATPDMYPRRAGMPGKSPL